MYVDAIMMLLSIFYLVPVIFIGILTWWYWIVHKYDSLKHVPGPYPLPIIGNANRIGTNTVDLLRSLNDLSREYGTVVKVWFGTRLHLLVTKPEIIEFITSSTQHLTKSNGYDLFRPWLGDGLLVSTDRKWKRRRRIITPTFHYRILEEFLKTFNRQTNVLLDVIKEKISQNQNKCLITNVYHYVNLCSLDMICETAFGISIDAQRNGNQTYVEAVTGFLEIVMLQFFSGPLRNPIVFRWSRHYSKYVKYLKILHEFTERIIAQRTKDYQTKLTTTDQNDDDDDKNDDPVGMKKRVALLDMLLEASGNGKYLSNEDIKEEVDTFMFEGHDTTSSAISFTLLALAQNPNIQEKVYEELINVLGTDTERDLQISELQDLPYFEMVLKETQRIYPPVPLIERQLNEDCIIDGLKIPKETSISMFLYGMNYNEDVFPNPSHFDPDRFLPVNVNNRHIFSYLPFSAGPRNCVGQKFAQLEIKAVLSKFVREFQVEIDPMEPPPEVGICSVLKSRNGIVLKITKRTT